MLMLISLLLVIVLAVILLPSAARQDELHPCVLARALCWVEILEMLFTTHSSHSLSLCRRVPQHRFTRQQGR